MRERYQQDAACRVIARLARERDQARQALASLAPAPVAAQQMDVDSAATGTQPLPAAVLAQIEATHKELSSARKKRAKTDVAAASKVFVDFFLPQMSPFVTLTLPFFLFLSIFF